MISSRRPRLLLSAVATVTVPGVLAACAALAHESAAQKAGRAAPVAPGNIAAFASAAGQQPRPVLHPKGQGMRLLAEAAAAGLATSYQGVELVSRWNVDGTSTELSSVWHRAGGLTLMQTSGVGVAAQDSSQLSYDGDGQDPEGVFGVTKPFVALIASHYTAQYTGLGSLAGRSAFVVAVRRGDGTIAARFWLDKLTKVPLGREEYDPNTAVIADDVFVNVKIGSAKIPAPLSAAVNSSAPESTSHAPAMKSESAGRLEPSPELSVPFDQVDPVAAEALGAGWVPMPATAQLITSLRGKGWAVPATLPGGLSLYSAALSGSVLDLGYSDGLFDVSLFVQPGALDAAMAGAERIKLNGHPVYSIGHGIVWAGHGFVYTILADAPPQTISAVVGALPHDRAPGFWRRLGRGLGRLASFVNPFR